MHIDIHTHTVSSSGRWRHVSRARATGQGRRVHATYNNTDCRDRRAREIHKVSTYTTNGDEVKRLVLNFHEKKEKRNVLSLQLIWMTRGDAKGLDRTSLNGFKFK